MTGAGNESVSEGRGGIAAALRRPSVSKTIWFSGLLSTAFLTLGSLLTFVAVMVYLGADVDGFSYEDGKVAVICAMPLVLFAILGWIGLKSWPNGRFPQLGLAAIVLQTAITLWSIAQPIRMILSIMADQSS